MGKTIINITNCKMSVRTTDFIPPTAEYIVITIKATIIAGTEGYPKAYSMIIPIALICIAKTPKQYVYAIKPTNFSVEFP